MPQSLIENFLSECANKHWDTQRKEMLVCFGQIGKIGHVKFTEIKSSKVTRALTVTMKVNTTKTNRNQISTCEKVGLYVFHWGGIKKKIFKKGENKKGKKQKECCDWPVSSRRRKILPVSVTYHKLDFDFICDIFKALEADNDLVLGVVQIAQMEDNDLITLLYGETKKNNCTIRQWSNMMYKFNPALTATSFHIINDIWFYALTLLRCLLLPD